MSGKSVVIALLLIGAAVGVAEWLSADGTPVPTNPTVTILSNDNTGTVLDVTVHGVSKEPRVVGDSTYYEVSIPGDFAANLDVGKPEVPKLSHLLGIPDSAQVSVSLQPLDNAFFDSILCYPY